ncbi:MAG: tetratricopeptide repeat protein [Desulfovibrionaceae bacterium]
MPELRAIGLYNRLAMTAANQGRTADALEDLAMALRLARETKRPLLEAVSKNNMGLVYQMSGRLLQAATCFRLALDMAREAKGDAHPLSRIIRTNLERLPSTVPFARRAA